MSRPNKVDAYRVATEEWLRAGGGQKCEHCGFIYHDHPSIPGFEWLTRLCDGRFVKL